MIKNAFRDTKQAYCEFNIQCIYIYCTYTIHILYTMYIPYSIHPYSYLIMNTILTCVTLHTLWFLIACYTIFPR